MNQLEATQADARRVAEPEPAELRSRLTQALSQSQAEKERADRLEAELQAAHEQMALNHGLVLATSTRAARIIEAGRCHGRRRGTGVRPEPNRRAGPAAPGGPAG